MNFNLFGCKIKLSFYFVFFITLIILIDNSGEFIWGCLAAIIHEFGHIFFMLIVGNKPSEIRFNLFDIDIVDNSRIKRDYKKDIIILFMGSGANLIFFIIIYIIYLITGIKYLSVPMSENLIMAVFNILPVESLDGGQILYMILNLYTSEKKSSMAVQIVSFIILLPLFIFGFYILLKSKYNFSLLIISCYLIAILLFKKNNVYL